MRVFLSSLCLMALMSCTTPQTAAQSVYLIQSDYAAALKVELAYSKLPRCGKPTSPRVCSDFAVIKKAQKADDLSWIAIQKAQTAVRTPGFGANKTVTYVESARAITNSFVDITNALEVK